MHRCVRSQKCAKISSFGAHFSEKESKQKKIIKDELARTLIGNVNFTKYRAFVNDTVLVCSFLSMN